jgi:hypothetical protein
MRPNSLARIRGWYAAFDHYADPRWIEDYARKHASELLARKGEILNKNVDAQLQCPEEFAYLAKYEPEIFARLDWEVRALAVAERLEPIDLKRPQQPPPETPPEKPAPTKTMQEKIAELVLELEYSPHLQDDTWLEKFARDPARQQQLLTEAEEILNEYTTLHADRALIDMLKATAPDIYQRAIWRRRALALAEQFMVEPPPTPPQKPRLSKEDHQAKIRNYRERMLERERVQAQDHMAKVKLRLDLLNEFRRELDQYDLDEDERQRREQEFLENLFNQEDNNDDSKPL